MPVSGPILIFLANGTQGSAIARVARERGHVARGLIRTRSGDSARDAVIGDLDDPVSLATAAEGCAHAVLQVPTGEQPVMVRQVGNALDALHHAGVRSIVLKLASASRTAPCVEPSFVANAAIEALVRSAGIPFAIVRPTMYLDNLLKPTARADVAERGVFSPPIGLHRDLVTYAEVLARESGQAAVDPVRLIAPMLERFIATDRAFAKARRASGAIQ